MGESLKNRKGRTTMPQSQRRAAAQRALLVGRLLGILDFVQGGAAWS
ncbi:MAG: hypothetical protein FWH07_01785 [Oscillospiraceae bacterium]|nr:hypothetical protein [Oscillospiraceae bacterium]